LKRARRFGGRGLAQETASVSHAIETIVVKDEEFGVPQQLDVDLYTEHVFARALVDGEQRILRIGPAPQAPVDLQLDDRLAREGEHTGELLYQLSRSAPSAASIEVRRQEVRRAHAPEIAVRLVVREDDDEARSAHGTGL